MGFSADADIHEDLGTFVEAREGPWIWPAVTSQLASLLECSGEEPFPKKGGETEAELDLSRNFGRGGGCSTSSKKPKSVAPVRAITGSRWRICTSAVDVITSGSSNCSFTIGLTRTGAVGFARSADVVWLIFTQVNSIVWLSLSLTPLSVFWA